MYYMCILRKCLVLIIYKYFDLYTIGQNYDQPNNVLISTCAYTYLQWCYIYSSYQILVQQILCIIYFNIHTIQCAHYILSYIIFYTSSTCGRGTRRPADVAEQSLYSHYSCIHIHTHDTHVYDKCNNNNTQYQFATYSILHYQLKHIP